MKKSIIALLLLSASAAVFAQKEGLKYLDSSFEVYDALSHSLWEEPELGYLEYRSVEKLTAHLEANGFKVEKGIAGIPTAFVASFGSGGPVIGILAEYDALPGLSQAAVPYRQPIVEGAPGHGCGHNLLGTGSVAGAVAISKWLAAGHKGTVKLFGCPAEEGGGGKAYMVREGCFDGVDAMLDWHPDVRNTVNRVSGLANVQVRFVFHGKSAHASSGPQNGRSALDAVEAFDYMMNLMREHVPSDSRIHYAITDGGKAPNIVPDRAEVLYYIRNPRRTVVGDILNRAVKAAEGAAMGTGTTMEYEIVSGNYERLPNVALSELIFSKLRQTGGANYSEPERNFAQTMMLGSGIAENDIPALLKQAETVCEPVAEGNEAWVSSDVGNVTWVVPTGSIRVAAFVPAGGGHCWQQTASAGTTIGTKGLLVAARTFYQTALELYKDRDLLRRVQEEFEARRGKDFRFEPLMGDRKPTFDYRK